MRFFIPFVCLALAACGGTSSTQGVGFGSGGDRVAAAATPSDPLARVKPSIVAAQKTGTPVPVHAASSSLTQAQLLSFSDASLETIYKSRPFTWFGGDKIAVHFKATFFTQGAISRTRVNGMDFAYLTGGTFIPDDKETIFALMAERAGCKYAGRGHAKKAVNYGVKGSRWVAAMKCP